MARTQNMSTSQLLVDTWRGWEPKEAALVHARARLRAACHAVVREQKLGSGGGTHAKGRDRARRPWRPGGMPRRSYGLGAGLRQRWSRGGVRKGPRGPGPGHACVGRGARGLRLRASGM